MGLVKEFKEFAVRGNVIDMAVGIIIGGAFGKIVTSLVNDVITPPIGFLLGGVDFKDLKFLLSVSAVDLKPVTVNYGQFIQSVFDFLIVAIAMFALVKTVNTLRTKLEREKAAEPTPPPVPTGEEKLLTEIRDLLKAGRSV
jgi:large conductance mechanosensitive channel